MILCKRLFADLILAPLTTAGLDKMSTPGVPPILVDVIRQYDLVLIQEIRDESQTAIYDLLNMVRCACAFSSFSGTKFVSSIRSFLTYLNHLLFRLSDQVNDGQSQADEFTMTLSARLGRTDSKEQYAYLYKVINY